MSEWHESGDELWKGIQAVAWTLKTFTEQYVIEQYHFDQQEAFSEDVALLLEDIEAVMQRVKKIRGML